MGTRTKTGEDSSAVDGSKPPAAKKPAATAARKKTPAKPRAKKDPAATKAAPKAKDRTPVRKNRTRAERTTGSKPAAASSPPPPTLADELGLSPQEALFVDCYLVHFNGRRAYQEAGYQGKSDSAASSGASHILRRPKVAEYLRRRHGEMLSRAEEQQDRLMQTLTYTAYGDVNELIYNRIDCCRFCYGEGNQYQFTPQEFERYIERHEEEVEKAKLTGADTPEFDPKGGVGYNPNLEPNEECPECFGRGKPEVVITDTRFLGPAAQAMYAGVKIGKNGIEVNINSQEKARETLAKIHKLYDDSTKVNVSFDPEELDARFGASMQKARQRSIETIEERRKAREERGAD